MRSSDNVRRIDFSPTTFTSRGLTVHDYDRRFKAEEAGVVPKDRKFRWKMLDDIST